MSITLRRGGIALSLAILTGTIPAIAQTLSKGPHHRPELPRAQKLLVLRAQRSLEAGVVS